MIVEKLSLGRGVQKTATDVGAGKRRIRETREKALIEELKRRGRDVFMGAKWLVAKSASSFDGSRV